MDEHKHRFLVTTGELTVTQTCRCGEVRVRMKRMSEFGFTNLYDRRRALPFHRGNRGTRGRGRKRK